MIITNNGNKKYTIGAMQRIYNNVNDRQTILENSIPDPIDISVIAGQTATGLIPTLTPRYRGAANTPGNNEGLITTTQGTFTANHNDWVMYRGVSGIWITAYVYQWDANLGRWNQLPRENNWEKYLDGVSDLTQGAPEGVFSTAFIKTLFAQTLNAEFANIRTRLRVGEGNDGIEIDGQEKWIQSANFSLANKTGWRIDKDGNVYFNMGTFHGTLDGADGTFTGRLSAATGDFSGDLNATFINISGQVTAGTNYVIRQNNIPFKRLDGAYRTSGTAKEIVTAARGTVRLRLATIIESGGTYTINIKVNGTTVATFTPGTGYLGYTHETNLSLTGEVNTILLDYTGTSEGTIFTTFQIMCAENPRFLKLLG